MFYSIKVLISIMLTKPKNSKINSNKNKVLYKIMKKIFIIKMNLK